MRLIHIFIAIMVFSLFSVVLYQQSNDFVKSYNESADLTSDHNETYIFQQLDILNEERDEISEIGSKAPGGSESTIPEETSATEATMQKSGIKLIASAGIFLYSIPKVLIYQVSTFLGISPVFTKVATSIIILAVAIILVSSILRNRL